jgi:hypothetical protein
MSLGKILNKQVAWLEGFEAVKKVVLGRTENCRHAFKSGHLKVQHDCDGGFIIKAFSGNGVVDIFIRCDDEQREYLKAQVVKRFS